MQRDIHSPVLTDAENELLNMIRGSNLMYAHEGLVNYLNQDMIALAVMRNKHAYAVKPLDAVGLVKLVMNPAYFGHMTIQRAGNSFAASSLLPYSGLGEMDKSSDMNIYLFFTTEKGFMIGTGWRKNASEGSFNDFQVGIFDMPGDLRSNFEQFTNLRAKALSLHGKTDGECYEGLVKKDYQILGTFKIVNVDSPDNAQLLIPDWYVNNLRAVQLPRQTELV